MGVRPTQIGVPEEAQRCCTCKTVKPLAGFYRNRTTPNGYTPECKPCHNSRVKESRARHAESIAAQKRQYYLQNREHLKAQALRWYRANPTRGREKANKWYHANKDRARVTQRKWKKANLDRRRAYDTRRRALKKGAAAGDFTNEQLLARLSMFAGCWLCGHPADCIDHVKPLARGGPHILANLRPACASCNNAKQDRWPFTSPPH